MKLKNLLGLGLLVSTALDLVFVVRINHFHKLRNSVGCHFQLLALVLIFLSLIKPTLRRFAGWFVEELEPQFDELPGHRLRIRVYFRVKRDHFPDKMSSLQVEP